MIRALRLVMEASAGGLLSIYSESAAAPAAAQASIGV
jgi:hypothetical protein